MKLRTSLLLLALAISSTACEKIKSSISDILDQDEPILTVVQSPWEKEPESLFKKFTDQISSEEEESKPRMRGIEVEGFPVGPESKKSPNQVAHSKKAKKPKFNLLQPYAVQVAAYRSLDNAQRQKRALKKKGFTPKISPVIDRQGQTWQSLQIGQFKGLASAQKLAIRYSDAENAKSVILKQGRIYKIISPDGKIKTPPKKPMPIASTKARRPLTGPYSFQTGGLYSAARAKIVFKKLTAKGYHPRMVKVQDLAKLDWWYVIRIGHYHSLEAADRAAEKFTLKENIPTSVQ